MLRSLVSMLDVGDDFRFSTLRAPNERKLAGLTPRPRKWVRSHCGRNFRMAPTLSLSAPFLSVFGWSFQGLAATLTATAESADPWRSFAGRLRLPGSPRQLDRCNAGMDTVSKTL